MEKKLLWNNLVKILSDYGVYLFSLLAVILATVSCVVFYTTSFALVVSLIVYGTVLFGVYIGYKDTYCGKIKKVKDVFKYVGLYSFILALFHFLSYSLSYQEEGIECHFWAYLVALIVSGILIYIIMLSIDTIDNNIPSVTLFFLLCSLCFLLPASCVTENEEIENRQLDKEEFMTVQKYYTEVFNSNTVYIVVCKNGTYRISPCEYPEVRGIHKGTKIRVLLDSKLDCIDGLKGYKRLEIKN